MTTAATPTAATDTVSHAASTPQHPQPYRELGLKDDEYRRIRVAAVIDDGMQTACWTYVWTADEGGLTPVDGVWTA